MPLGRPLMPLWARHFRRLAEPTPLETARAGPGALPSGCAWPRRPRVLRPGGPGARVRCAGSLLGATPRLRMGTSRAFAGVGLEGSAPEGAVGSLACHPPSLFSVLVSTASSHHQRTRRDVENSPRARLWPSPLWDVMMRNRVRVFIHSEDPGSPVPWKPSHPPPRTHLRSGEGQDQERC